MTKLILKITLNDIWWPGKNFASLIMKIRLACRIGLPIGHKAFEIYSGQVIIIVVIKKKKKYRKQNGNFEMHLVTKNINTMPQ